MHWYDEIPQLFRLTLSEIGFAFYVREKMKNDLIADREELLVTLGPDWEVTIDNMKKRGVLTVSQDGRFMRFSVQAPGDKKRERCKKIGRRKRALHKFEHDIER